MKSEESYLETIPFEIKERIERISLMVEASNVIVLDVGSGELKAGYGGQDKPHWVMPSIVGRPRHPRLVTTSTFIGGEAKAKRGILSLKSPVERGIITNFEDYSLLLKGVFEESFKETNIEISQRKILLSETPLNPLVNREKTLQIIMEEFKVSDCCFAPQAFLALLATGRKTGVVCEIGDGVIHSVPVFEGLPIQQSILRLEMGGRDITNYALKLFCEEGYSYCTLSAACELMKTVKENFGFVSLDYEKDRQSYLENPEAYAIDYMDDCDCQTYRFRSERFRYAECLFQPGLLGLESEGIHQLIYSSIQKVHPELRKEMFANIVLGGGCSLFPGISERLDSEIKKLAPIGTNVSVIGDERRKYLDWLGGSIFASLPAFKRSTISQSDYDEYGANIIHWKCCSF